MVNEIVLENPGNLLRCALECSEQLQTQAWFRGQARDEAQNWHLVPKLFRSRYMRDHEVMLMHRFKNLAPARRLDCPGPERYSDWLFIMQHYGLKTRLLDWTDSVLVAAFFAVWESDHSEHDAIVWALNPSLLNYVETGQAGVLTASHGIAKHVIRLAFEDSNQRGAFDSKILALEPHQIDARMMAQHASFTIHGEGRSLNSHPDAGRYLAKIRIPHQLKEHVRGALNFAGVRESTVFPDLGHLASELNKARNERDVFPQGLPK